MSLPLPPELPPPPPPPKKKKPPPPLLLLSQSSLLGEDEGEAEGEAEELEELVDELLFRSQSALELPPQPESRSIRASTPPHRAEYLAAVRGAKPLVC